MNLSHLEDNLAGRLHAIRKDKKLSQEEFGNRIGVSRSAICNYESGTRPISNQVILAVCREFEVSDLWLRHGTGEPYEPKKDGVIDSLIRQYNCSKFEGDFLKTYFKMTEDERSSFVRCVYRLFEPLMKGMAKKNPFADYFSVTYGADSPEANQTSIPGDITGLLQKPVSEMTDAEVQALKEEIGREIDEEKEAEEKLSDSSGTTGKSGERKEVG